MCYNVLNFKGYEMKKDIKLFFIGIASSFRPDGYERVVSSYPKSLGEISKRIDKKRQENIKLAYEKLNEKTRSFAY